MSLLISETIESILNEGSCEAIRFQADSGFPKELIAVFTKVFQVAQEYDKEYAASDNSDKFLIKHTLIKKFIEGEIGPEIKRIVKTHTGFMIDNIIAEMPLSTSMLLDIRMYTKNITEMKDTIVSKLMSKPSKSDDKQKNDYITYLLAINRSLNKTTGKLQYDVPVVCDIHIPVGMFVLNDFITNTTVDNTFTPEEITAAMLHEIGHVFSTIECLYDINYLGYYGNNILRDLTVKYTNTPTETIADVITYADKHVATVKNKTHHLLLTNANNTLKHISKMLANIDVNEDDRKSYNHTWLLGIGAVVTKLIIMDFAAMISVALLPIPFSELDNFGKAENSKSSNEYVTGKNFSMYERLADEYVSRFQMSKYFNSSLIKSYRIMHDVTSFKGGLTHNQAFRDSNKVRLMVEIVAIPCTMLNYFWNLKLDNSGTSDYENIHTRLQRNINNMIDVIKDQQLDQRIRDSLVKDIEEMELTLQQYNDKSTLHLLDKIVQFILRIVDHMFSSVRYIFGSAHLDKDYFELFEHLDNMLSNKSFYYSAKIAGIMRSVK